MKYNEKLIQLQSQIKEHLDNELDMFNKILSKLTEHESPLIQKIINNIINKGGKRLRPILNLLIAKSYKNELSEKDVFLAIAIELMHTATLLHDDVIDSSEMRRGSHTANYLFGNKSSILVGDYLLGKAFEFMTKAESLPALSLLAKASIIITEGEVKQLEAINNIITKCQYLDIIEKKTATLFSIACATGVVLYSDNQDTRETLSKYGLNLGINFQIIDDLLDYSSNASILGKNPGDDFYEGKVTLPIILTYEYSDNEDKERIKDIIHLNQRSKEDFLYIQKLIEKYHIYNHIKDLSIEYTNSAINDIDQVMNNTKEKDILINIAKYSQYREY